MTITAEGRVRYLDYLKSPAWRAKREDKLKSANRQCQICRSEYDLQVHHLTYKNLYNEKRKDLIVLCEPCHIKYHDEFCSARFQSLIYDDY